MPATSVINMSQLRVAGVGGLGLVAMAIAVALDVPRIGRSLALGLVLGAVCAAVLILRRRRSGPMPSSGRHSGANEMLSIDDTPAPSPRDERGSSDPGPGTAGRTMIVAPCLPSSSITASSR